MNPDCAVTGNIYTLISHIYKCSHKKAENIFRKRVSVKQININLLKGIYENIKNINNKINSTQKIELPYMSKSNKAMLKYMNWRNDRKQHNVMNIDMIIKKYNLYYCSEGRYAGRIIMPIRDLDGNYIQFNDRSVFHDAENKSLHMSGTNINNLIHGLSEAYGKKIGILVEGSFDMFQVESVLRSNSKYNDYGCVNNMGCCFNDERAYLLSNTFERLLIFTDNDKAGLGAAYKIKYCMEDLMDVRLITKNIPYEKDPAICTKDQIKTAINKRYKANTLKKFLLSI
jgi:DNA primase